MKGNFHKHLMTFILLVTGLLFAASTVILVIGMLPTLAVNMTDRTRQKSQTLSVGLMNFAGCVPFLLELWMSASPNALDMSISILVQPKTVVIIYVIAAAGYAIERAVTGMVATMMQQRAQFRLREIDRQLKEMVDRWDYYVDGTVPLDDFGFPERKPD